MMENGIEEDNKRSKKSNLLALIAIGIFIFMTTLDGSIVNIALPTMSRVLHVSTSQITWVVTVYLILISAVVLLFGRVADLIGKSTVSKIGWAVFIVGSFMAGFDFGGGLTFLLLARVVQALGGSMMMATSFGLIAQIYPDETRAKALAINSMFVSVGSIAGPALGGLILQFASWHYIFWINVPIGIIAWIFGNRVLPKDVKSGTLKDVDIKGGAQMAAFIIILFLTLNFGSTLGWTSFPIIAGAVLGIILFLTFIRTQRRVEKPLIELGMFRNKIYSMSVLMALINFTVAMFSSIILPFYLQDLRLYQPGFAGILMMAYPLAMLIFSPIAGIVSDMVDKEIVTFVGITGIVLSQIGYMMISGASSYWYVVGVLFLQGAATGVFQSPNNALVMGMIDRKYLGIGGSINSLARNVAFVLGTSLATIILFFTMSVIMHTHVNTYIASRPDVFLRGMHVAFICSTCLSGATWVLGLFRLIHNSAVKRAARRA